MNRLASSSDRARIPARLDLQWGSGLWPGLLVFLLCFFLATVTDAAPPRETVLSRTLSRLTDGYEGTVVLVRAHRPTGPDPNALAVSTDGGVPRTCGVLWSAGVVVDTTGLVLTCVDGAQPTDSLVVMGRDGRERRARFLSQDSQSGVSLLRVGNGSGLRPAPRTSPLSVREGDWVVVLPFFRDDETEEPRIGTLDRILPATSTSSHAVFRIEVEERAGICGSPILDGNGSLIGMVVESDVEGGTSSWLGLSPEPYVQGLPRSLLFDIADRLAVQSEHAQGFLGVQPAVRSPVSPDADSVLSPIPLEVLRVLPGSPAEQAGIRTGDQIVSLGGATVTNLSDVSDRISNTPPGTRVRLELRRGEAPLVLYPLIGDRTSLDWMERRMARNLRRQNQLQSEIDELRIQLEELRELQKWFQ